MGRPANPNRRPELLQHILQHVSTASLAGLTFRNLASALGVSTYVLVYHFGSRQQLIDAILDESVRVHSENSLTDDVTTLTVEGMREWLNERFAETLSSTHKAGLRLQFEAGALEHVDSDFGSRVTTAHRAWRELVAAWILAQGIPATTADRISRFLIDSLYGLQFGFLVEGEESASREAFALVVDTALGLVKDAARGRIAA